MKSIRHELGGLWLLHPKPKPDELLSSWLIRLAKAYHQKLHTFCVLRWGRTKQIWNRDIDKMGDVQIEASLVRYCAVSRPCVESTLLRSYEGRLYEHHNPNGNTLFLLPLGVFHRTRRRFGTQFCPKCLATDIEPFVRKKWRLAITVVCTEHRCLLQDRCPKCKRAFIPHRHELGDRFRYIPRPIYRCYNCGFDLRRSHSPQISHNHLQRLVRATKEHQQAIERGWIRVAPNTAVYSHLYFIVLRRLMTLVSSPRKTRFRQAVSVVARHLQIAPIKIRHHGRQEVEHQPVLTRAYALIIADWLLANWPDRFLRICRHHHIWETPLVRDVPNPPYWFWREVHGQLSLVYSPWRKFFGKRKKELRSYTEFGRKLMRRLSPGSRQDMLRKNSS